MEFSIDTIQDKHVKILIVKTVRGDRLHIFADVRPLKTFYILLEWGQQHAQKTTAGRQINYCRRTSFVGVPLLSLGIMKGGKIQSLNLDTKEETSPVGN